MDERIYLSAPHMGGKEQFYVNEAFVANWVSPAGPNLSKFENELGKYLKGSHVAALSSGTAAIHLALIIAGVKQGDEVVCSTFTFSGSCNPIAYQKATPVFVDSEPMTWNMDPSLLEECIQDRIKKTGKKPKAIILVHLYGMPAKLEEISRISRQYEIPLIEDAAEALGSTYMGELVGTKGEFGILSFNGNKIITTSGGGALICSNEGKIARAKFLATQARDNAPHYQHSEIGFNYRLSNICAGIGLGQLEVLGERISQRRAVFQFYKENMTEEVEFLDEPNGFFSNRWITTVTFKNPKISYEQIRLALEDRNIESRPLWKPMHLQPVFVECPFYSTGVSESLFKTGLCLPSGSAMARESQTKVIEIVSKSIKQQLQ